jgi:hypothetical protein
MPKWPADACIFGWLLSFAKAGTMQAATSRADRAINTWASFREFSNGPLDSPGT